MEELDHKAFTSYMTEVERGHIRVTVCPPQPTPKWAREPTAKWGGTRISEGCYKRGMVRV